MRKLMLVILCLLLIASVRAQSDESCPTPAFDPEMWVVSSGSIYNEPGGNVTQTPEEELYLNGEPTCLDGVNWWPTRLGPQQTGWLPESELTRYLLTLPEPPSLGIPLTQPIPANTTTPLPSVIPSATPDQLDIPFITNWDWDAMFTDAWYETPPNPYEIEIPDAYAGDLPVPPVDLDTVYFVTDAGLNRDQLALLVQNGFVVVPAGAPQFDTVYRDGTWDHQEGKGDFITTDAMLHSLFISYRNALMFLEIEAFYPALIDVLVEAYTAAEAQWMDASGTNLEEQARNAALYYAIPMLVLADAQSAMPLGKPLDQPELPDWLAPLQKVISALREASPEIIDSAQPIADQIRDAEGTLPVPILENYDEDFSQYIVRGYYTSSELLSTYFRAMMWLGRITFTTRSDADTLTGLLVLRALDQADITDTYARIADTLDFMVGPIDDFGPMDYLPIARTVYSDDLPLAELSANLPLFKAQVAELPGPRINSIPLPLGTEADQVEELTRGFRLFGQRFTLDGYIMQQLIYPEVGNASQSRALPLGLDVSAALGSDVAYNLVEDAGAADYENYVENLSSLRGEVNDLSPEAWMENLYGGWLWSLQPLVNRDLALRAPMMQTEAWHRRELNTMLASWTELKYATLLYAEQPMGGLGGGGYTPPVLSRTVVEPNPDVFARIAIVAATLRQGLIERGFLSGEASGFGSPLQSISEALVNLARLSAEMAHYAAKEVAGHPLDYWELYDLQERFDDRLWYIRYTVEIWLPDPPETLAIVTDVASNVDAGIVLQEAVGDVDYIYVITEGPYGLQLTRGAVYSYYEFVGDINERMTDDEWRELLDTDSAPPRPEWTALYFAEGTPEIIVCEGALPTRLSAGGLAYVAPDTILRVRDAPGGEYLSNMDTDTRIQITGQPVCLDGILWWPIETMDGSLAGWSAEATDEYFLIPDQ